MTIIDQVREMIAADETEKSLKELSNYVKENNAEVIDNLVMLRGRMKKLGNAIQNNTIDDEDAARERARINEAILKLLPQLTPEYLAQASQVREPARQAILQQTSTASPTRNRKMIYIIGGAVLFIVILILVFNNGGAKDADIQESSSESLTTQEETFLENVIANKSIWVSSNGANTFQFESNTICQEIVEGEVTNTFDVVGSDSDFITLHDPNRKMNFRIGANVTQYQYEGEDAWRDLYNGAWISKSDEQ